MKVSRTGIDLQQEWGAGYGIFVSLTPILDDTMVTHSKKLFMVPTVVASDINEVHPQFVLLRDAKSDRVTN